MIEFYAVDETRVLNVLTLSGGFEQLNRHVRCKGLLCHDSFAGSSKDFDPSFAQLLLAMATNPWIFPVVLLPRRLAQIPHVQISVRA